MDGMRHLPPLAAVRVFEAAARHQNFTAAANELGMTQAAVSYQIRVLEERLGVPLFARANRRVTLTETGRRIMPLVSGAFDSLDDAFGIARTSSEAVLCISCASTFGPNWLVPRIGAFQLGRPELAVRLHTSNTLVDFARDDVDAAIRGGNGEWPGLVAHFLMRMPLTPLASPEYLARQPAVTGPDDVLRMNRVSPDDSWWTLWREQVGGMLPEEPQAPGVRLDSQIMEGRAALAGNGIAILNPILWRQEIEAARLVEPLPRHAFDTGDLWLVYPEHRRNAPKIRALRDWLLSEVARDAASDARGFYKPRKA